MRILMLSQFIPPIIGGEETHVYGLSHELACRGHDVAIASLNRPETNTEEVVDNIQLFRLNGLIQKIGWLYSETSRHHAAPYPDPGILAGLKRVIQSWKPDVVHAHNWLLHSFLPIKRWSKASLVVTLHDYSFQCATKRMMYMDEQPCSGPGFVKCQTCAVNHYGLIKGTLTVRMNSAMRPLEKRAVDMFLAVSRAVAQGNGLENDHLPYQIIPNFIPDTFGSDRSAQHPLVEQLPKEDFLLFVGDISKEKGVDILLKAYAQLSDAPPLVLIGRKVNDTPDVFPSNVHYLGSWPHDAIMEAWHRCTIAFAPSTWAEPFGIVVLEAMLAGKPVIASAIGGLIDIVEDQKTGLLVPPGDVQALREAMITLLSNPTLRQQMGNAGKQSVSRFQAKYVVPQIVNVYETLQQSRIQQ